MSRFVVGPLFNKLVSVSRVRWQRVLEDSRIMRSYLQKVNLIIFDDLTKERSIAMYLFSLAVLRLVRKSGMLFTALYLKQCTSCLQKAYGGVPQPKARLPVLVSLTKSGYPRIIPSFHRRLIMEKGPRSGLLVKLYLSAFSINKIILLAPKITKNTFASIVTPTESIKKLKIFYKGLSPKLKDLILRYVPSITDIPLHQGITWRPTWKAVPTYRQLKLWFETHGVKEVNGRKISYHPNIFSAQVFELLGYSYLIERIHTMGKQMSPGILWFPRIRFAFDSNNQSFSEIDAIAYDKNVGPQLPGYRDMKIIPFPGRLGQTVDGGGKRRIFAIGNYINQRLLYPVHVYLMSILRRISMDGTFNQNKPLLNLIPAKHCFSFDLKSATDRFPLSFLCKIMQCMFGCDFASSVVNSTLAFNFFHVPFVKRKSSTVCFVAGQPLGYYSSWPLFSLAHHILIWWCADQVKPGIKFRQYAVLGDDVLITDPDVAKVYEKSLSDLGVAINYQKSLISDCGAAEFGKRFRYDMLKEDLSPISIRSLLNSYHPFGLVAIADKYNIKRFSTLARIGGAGFKTVSRLTSAKKRSLKFERAKALLSKPRSSDTFPFELWLGRGYPLDPYIRGRLIEIVRLKLKPKELHLPPEELFVNSTVLEFGEYSTIRGWVSMWLDYCHWYFKTVMDPDINLESIVSAPELKTDWRARNSDMEDLVRFGLLWKLFDLVGQQGLKWVKDHYEPIWYSGLALSEPSWLAGWILGSDPQYPFLVRMEGLTQPSVRGGITYKENATRIIRYKTLGVSERIVVIGYR